MQFSHFQAITSWAFEYYNKKRRDLGYSCVTIPSSCYKIFTIWS